MTARDPDALVRELEAAGVPSEAASVRSVVEFYNLDPDTTAPSARERVTRRAIATDCDTLAPILVRHASPEVRAAILRELLRSPDMQCVPCGGQGVNWDGTMCAACDASGLISPPVPEAPDAD